MGLLSKWRGPRAVDGVRWRSLRPDDRDAIIGLVAQSVSADGATQTTDGSEFYLGMFGERRVGGFAGEQLVAAASLPTRLEPTVEGHVHPSYRGRGLGGALLDWALARAPSDAVVKATALTGEKQRLFESRGLHLTAAVDRLWRPLGEPVEIAPPPPGISIAEWDDAEGFDVYCEAFAELPSNPFADAEWPDRSFGDWIKWAADMELDASVSLLARDEQSAPVGFRGVLGRRPAAGRHDPDLAAPRTRACAAHRRNGKGGDPAGLRRARADRCERRQRRRRPTLPALRVPPRLPHGLLHRPAMNGSPFHA